MNPLKLIRKNILALEPYSTARDEFTGGDISVWVDANESPYENGVNRYPDPHQHLVKERVSELYGMPVENIFIGGAGSDEAIDIIYRVFCEPRIDNAIAITPSYGVYKVAADINDVGFREVQLGADFHLPVLDLLNAADAHSKLLWICSPNNPTGNAFPREQILFLLKHFEGMVVVDEAYADFSDKESMLSAIADHPNLIVLRTFSKAWGMAGMRAGMAFADPRVIRYFDRVKYPYNMSRLVQEELLKRTACDVAPQIAEIKAQAAMMLRRLPALECVRKVYPSDANFILAEVSDAAAVYDYLEANGVIVRNRSSMPGCGNCLRITVGTPAENRRIIELLEAYESGKF